jgi:hypothetical protein
MRNDAILAHAEFAKMVQDTLAAVSIYHQALAQNPEFFYRPQAAARFVWCSPSL